MFSKQDYIALLQQLQQAQAESLQNMTMLAALIDDGLSAQAGGVKTQLNAMAESKQRHKKMIDEIIILIEKSA